MRALGIILAGGNSNKLGDLSAKRAVAAMPITGSYRAIDFALSNMTNSHIQKVAVFTQYNTRSLNEHLNSSKWWDFGRKQGGLFIFTPTITAANSYWYKGTADALYQKEIDFVAMKGSEKIYVQVSDNIADEATFRREVGPLLQIRDAYPKMLLVRTRHEDSDYEGISIVDIPRWLLRFSGR